jgi:CDP-paratose 2-epimerase
LFIPDICRLIDAEIERMDSVAGEVFCAGGDQINTSLLECTAMIEAMTGKKSTTSVVETARMADHRVYRSDVRKAKRLLGWHPQIGMEPGLESIYRWVRDNEDVLRKLY